MKVYKKLLSILLAFMLILCSFCLIPVSTSAAQNQLVKYENYEYVLWGDGTASIYSCSTDEAEVVVPATINGHTITSINNGAYSNNPAIESVIVSEGIKNVSYKAFADCKNLKKVLLPSTLTDIGYGAFQHCRNLTDIEIPAGVTMIDDSAFSGCKSLKGITIPDTVETIGEYSFAGCDLFTEITIPDTVKVIKDEAFAGCSSLDEINLPEDSGLVLVANPFLDTAWYEVQPDGIIYLDNYVLGYKGHMSYGTELVFKEGSKYISIDAFKNEYYLASVVFPDTMKSVGGNAFSRCENLSSVKFSDSITELGSRSFEECDRLKEIVLPSNLLTMKQAFTGAGIESVVIPESVINADGAFSSCHYLSQVTLPENMTKVSSAMFSGCYSLESIVIPDSVTSIENSAFQYCTNLRNVTYNGVLEEVGADTFKETEWFNSKPDGLVYLNNALLGYNGNDASLDEIVIKDGTTVVAGSAFEYKDKLTKVTFPEGLKYIGHGAFSGSNVSGSIVLPDTIEFVGNFAFFRTPINALVIEGSATIGTRAFMACEDLKTVTLSASIDEIEVEAFGMLLGMTVPEKNEGFTIYGYKNTAAEKYALEVGFKFVDLEQGVVGDVNKDGDVTIKDATLIQKYIANLKTIDETALDFSDVNGDTEVNIKDATMIQKFLADLLDRFNIGF